MFTTCAFSLICIASGKEKFSKQIFQIFCFSLNTRIIATVQSFEDLIIQIRDHWLVKDQRVKIKKVLDHCLKELPNRCFDERNATVLVLDKKSWSLVLNSC